MQLWCFLLPILSAIFNKYLRVMRPENLVGHHSYSSIVKIAKQQNSTFVSCKDSRRPA
jgi:hypothetical protein